MDKESPNRNISVNHVHPGYVDTDMTSHKGPLTIEEGAKSTLYAALEAEIKGDFFRNKMFVVLKKTFFSGKYIWYDCQLVDWFGESTP